MKELTNKEIEIKNLADDLSFDLDTSDLWASIEPQLPPQTGRKKRPVWWMVTGVLLGLVLVAGVFAFVSNNSDYLSIDPSVSSSQSQQLISSFHNTEQTITSTNSNSLTESTKTSAKTNIKTSISQKIEDKKLKSTNLTPAKKDIANQTKVVSKKNDRIKNVNYSASVPNNSTSNTKFSKESNSIQSQKDSDVDKKINFPFFNKTNIVSTKQPIISKRVSLDEFSPFQPLTIQQIVAREIQLTSPVIEINKISTWKSFWQINSGVNKLINRVTFLDSEIEFDPQFEKEESLIGLSNSVYFGQENRSGWRWLGGLSHSRLSTRYSNFDKLVSESVEPGVESKTIDQFGNENQTLGDITITTVIQNDIIWHKNHDYLNIQAGIGKRHYLFDRLSIVTDVMAGYNFWSQHNGYYIEEDNPSITKFSNGDEHPYQNKGIDLSGSVAIEYDFSRFSIALSSYYNHGLGSMTIKNNYSQIKNSHYGIQLGVVYRP